MDQIKLNVGCGTDYREGYLNIDGSSELQKVDKIIDISNESLLNYYSECSVDFILANDIIEHHFHWEAVKILRDFFILLKVDGSCEIRVPDCEYIISNKRLTLETKLTLLFGGQDIPQGKDEEMNKSRKNYPHFFCHKYGWSMERMKNEMETIGFTKIIMKREGTNFITYAKKLR